MLLVNIHLKLIVILVKFNYIFLVKEIVMIENI